MRSTLIRRCDPFRSIPRGHWGDLIAATHARRAPDVRVAVASDWLRDATLRPPTTQQALALLDQARFADCDVANVLAYEKAHEWLSDELDSPSSSDLLPQGIELSAGDLPWAWRSPVNNGTPIASLAQLIVASLKRSSAGSADGVPPTEDDGRRTTTEGQNEQPGASRSSRLEDDISRIMQKALSSFNPETVSDAAISKILYLAVDQKEEVEEQRSCLEALIPTLTNVISSMSRHHRDGTAAATVARLCQVLFDASDRYVTQTASSVLPTVLALLKTVNPPRPPSSHGNRQCDAFLRASLDALSSWTALGYRPAHHELAAELSWLQLECAAASASYKPIYDATLRWMTSIPQPKASPLRAEFISIIAAVVEASGSHGSTGSATITDQKDGPVAASWCLDEAIVKRLRQAMMAAKSSGDAPDQGLAPHVPRLIQTSHELVVSALCRGGGGAVSAYALINAHKYHGLKVTAQLIRPVVEQLAASGDSRAFNLVDVCTLFSGSRVDRGIIERLIQACAVYGDHHRARTMVGLLREDVPGFMSMLAPETILALQELKIVDAPPTSWFDAKPSVRSLQSTAAQSAS